MELQHPNYCDLNLFYGMFSNNRECYKTERNSGRETL